MPISTLHTEARPIFFSVAGWWDVVQTSVSRLDNTEFISVLTYVTRHTK